MKIAVCIKQVPASNEVKMDPQKGILLRDGIVVKINPHDLVAIEAALQIKEQFQEAQIIAITMGPHSAREALITSYAMGVDQGILLSDPQFAGADVFATSYTLAQAIIALGQFDLVICGKKTTDGDTGQVGPSLAEHLKIPHIYGILSIEQISEQEIVVTKSIEHRKLTAKISLPCVLVVSKEAFQPRLPSLKLKLAAKKKQIKTLTLADLNDQDLKHFGLEGSPTQVEQIFLPEKTKKQPIISGDAEYLSDCIIKKLVTDKFISLKNNNHKE
ncbi:MAG: electron transfer flavoprotein subunit beta/FixA family protein [Spirochaetes bacterium]|nr:electron transfer flavoprotein subunit beta/FixA family protein [Spirochaetota bacterium]